MIFGENGKVEALGGIGLPTMCTGASGASGRVAVYYNTLLGFETNDVSVYSRPGWAGAGNAWSPSGDGRGTLYMEVIPEPSTLLLMGIGGLLLNRKK
jgi:hypothetical protein